MVVLLLLLGVEAGRRFGESKACQPNIEITSYVGEQLLFGRFMTFASVNSVKVCS